MLSSEVALYRQLTGDYSEHTPVSRIGGYLDGYERGTETRWIPCSERMPEESGLYIVTNIGRWVEPVGTRYYNIRAAGGFWSGHPGDRVVAWMPLPEPYKEMNDTGKEQK